MINENKISRFILELIKKTKKGIVEWEQYEYSPHSEDSNEKLIDYVYFSQIKDKKFRIFKYKIKTYTEEYEWDWSERIKLAVIDDEGNVIYDFPYEYSLHNLYDSVREKTSGISDFIDDFLN